MRWIVTLRQWDYGRRHRKHHSPAPGTAPLFYLHIGKTGGSFITDLCRSPQVFDASPAPFIRLTHNIKHVHMPRGSRFLFGTRDPLSRFVSGFNSRKYLRKMDNLSKGEKRAFALFDTPNDLALALRDANPATRKEAQAAMGAIVHVNAPHAGWFADKDRLAGDIAAGRAYRLRQEALNADLRAALEANGYRIDRSQIEDRPRKHTKRDGFSTQLDPAAQEHLRAHYEADYAFLAWLDEQGLRGAADDVTQRAVL